MASYGTPRQDGVLQVNKGWVELSSGFIDSRV